MEESFIRTKNTDAALVLCEFMECYYQNFVNQMCRDEPIIRNFKGRCIGCSPFVQIVEGRWAKERAMGVLVFETILDAIKWADFDYDRRHHDWNHAGSVIILPLIRIVDLTLPVFQICEVLVPDANAYQDQYATGHLPVLMRCGGLNVVGHKMPAYFRGGHKPGYLIINQWPSIDTFFTYYTAADYKARREQYKLAKSETNMVLIRCDPLTHHSNTRFPPIKYEQRIPHYPRGFFPNKYHL